MLNSLEYVIFSSNTEVLLVNLMLGLIDTTHGNTYLLDPYNLYANIMPIYML